MSYKLVGIIVFWYLLPAALLHVTPIRKQLKKRGLNDKDLNLISYSLLGLACLDALIMFFV